MTQSFISKHSFYVASNIALTVKQSRVDIVGALLSLSSAYKLLGDGNTNFKYDMSYLDAKKGLLLICYAEIVDPQRNHRLLLDQSFVLRRKEQDKDDKYVHAAPALFKHELTMRLRAVRTKVFGQLLRFVTR